MTKRGIFGEKISACFTNLQLTCFTCPNEHFEENFPIEEIFLLKRGGSSSGFETKLLGLLTKNIVSNLQTAFFKSRGQLERMKHLKKNVWFQTFSDTAKKNFDVVEKNGSFKKVHSTSPEEHFALKTNLGKII